MWIGGLAALLAAAVWLAGIILAYVSTPPTAGGVDTLQRVAARRSLYILKQVLSLAPLGLTMVTFVALYPVPERCDRGLALLAAVLGVVSLLMLSGGLPRGIAYLGIVTGALGVTGEALRTLLGSAYAVYGVRLLV